MLFFVFVCYATGTSALAIQICLQNSLHLHLHNSLTFKRVNGVRLTCKTISKDIFLTNRSRKSLQTDETNQV